MSRSKTLRVIAVIGLLSAAFFAALPWLGCASFGRVNGSLEGYARMASVCTVGFFPGQQGYGVPGPPYGGSLVIGVAHLIAAVYVAVSKRL